MSEPPADVGPGLREEEFGRLQLADWRRHVGELYAELRSLAALDPGSAWNHWRRTREELFREHPSSPVKGEERARFSAHHFEYDPGLRFELPVVPGEAAYHRMPEAAGGAAGGRVGPAVTALSLPVSTGQPFRFERVGWVELPLANGPRRLALFWLPEYSGGLFLPFRDATNGAETYGGGRYLLDTAKGADLGGDPGRGTLILDFNFAYQPSCAFDPRWSCPLSPPENRLDVAIRAGECIR